MRLGDADRIPDFVLMRLPEATIVGIVETYWRRKRQDPYLADKKIFEAIEAKRLRVIEKRAMPCPLTLSSYIKYRIGIEHTGAAAIMGNFVEEAIEEANRVLGPR